MKKGLLSRWCACSQSAWMFLAWMVPIGFTLQNMKSLSAPEAMLSESEPESALKLNWQAAALSCLDVGWGDVGEQDARKGCQTPDGRWFICDRAGVMTVVDPTGEKILITCSGQPEGSWDPFEHLHLDIGPVFKSGKLFVMGNLGSIFCLNPGESVEDQVQLIWHFKALAPMLNEPSIREGRVFVQDAFQNLYALDAEDGHLLWERSLLDTSMDQRVYGGLKSNFIPFPLAGGKLLALDAQGFLTLLEASSGERLDKALLSPLAPSLDPVKSTFGGLARMRSDVRLLYIATHQGIFAIDKQSLGQNNRLNLMKVWSHDDPVWSDLCIDQDRCYYTTLRGELVAVQKRTGECLWRARVSYDPEAVPGAPCLINGPEGEPWILVSDRKGNLQGFDAISGEPRLQSSLKTLLGQTQIMPCKPEHGFYETIFLSPKKPGHFFLLSRAGSWIQCCLLPSPPTSWIDPFDL